MLTLPSQRHGLMMIAAALCAVLMPAAPARSADLFSIPTEWQIGGIVLVAPTYDGARNYRAVGFPFILPAGKGDGAVQFKGVDDIRLRLVSVEGLELGPLAGWRFGRSEDRDSRLTGLGDIDGGLVVGAYGAYRLGQVAAFVSYHQQVTGDDTGSIVRFGLEAKSKVQPSLTLNGKLGATWASADYMDAYFSVSPQQSLNSGLARFDADSGIKDVFLGLGADLELDQRWTLTLNGRYARLVGDAADSPIVQNQNQFSGSLGLSYKFSIGN